MVMGNTAETMIASFIYKQMDPRQWADNLETHLFKLIFNGLKTG